MNPIKVLVIEPNARARLALVTLLKSSADIAVVGIASDAMQARMQVKLRKPDALIIATDQQSEAAGKFLANLMRTTPMPVLMLSSQLLPANDGERQVMRSGGSLQLKPVAGISAQDHGFCAVLKKHLQSITKNFKATGPLEPRQPAMARPIKKAAMQRHNPVLHKLVAIGASTGGTEALRHVVSVLPADFPAVVIVQHIPKAFATTFINKLNRSSAMHVVAATEGAEIYQGHIYVGAGDEHFRVEKQGMALLCRVGGQQRVNGHCPSVGELFDSVALHAGSKAVGALMTGMGDDGASGLKKMRDARARTVAQDKDSSVVWGMPGAAVKLGAAEVEVALDQLGEKLMQLAK